MLQVEGVGEVHVILKHFRGGQGFAAFGSKFEEPPIWVFLTPSLNKEKQKFKIVRKVVKNIQ